jgi:hypothetical protein
VPEALRYGSQAVGGVVEATNNRIPFAAPVGGWQAQIMGATTTVLAAYSPPEKIGCIRKDSLAFFAITSPSVHSVQRPENINNLYPVDTSRRESGQTLTEIGRI